MERPLLLGGERVETGAWDEVRSPYSGELVGRVARAGALETAEAIARAHAALAEPLPAHERAAILERAAAALAERREEAAGTICAEAGKPLKAARVEAERAVSTLTFAAVAARTLAGEVVPLDAAPAGEGKLAFTLRVPVGVVGAISPFNFPLNLVAHKLAPALAAGNATVLKPAAQTPLSAYLLAEILHDAGLPRGWLSVVTGPSAEIGDVLVADERVRALTFTGSGAVGWSLRERAPQKKVLLELGNATPAVVAADADLDAAAAALAPNAFSFAGQSCISVQRIYVEREAYEPFLARFLAEVGRLRVGDPAAEETDVGPVIDRAARERILQWVGEALDAGARLLAGGSLVDGLLVPTVLADPPDDAKVSCEEVFGPVCTVSACADLDEAVRRANGTPYGLQAGLFTRSIQTALRLAPALEFGGVTVNEAPTFRADQMPYGGIKASGNTREGPQHAVRELTEERLVVLAL
jgi:acyl-CoA reductase-like NAD-dependent aldehyde dehydrogenase